MHSVGTMKVDCGGGSRENDKNRLSCSPSLLLVMRATGVLGSSLVTKTTLDISSI